MLIDEIRTFVSLSNQLGIKGSDNHVKEKMVTLRQSGFTSDDISELSGGKWSATLVRQYTKGWGGVDEKLKKEKSVLMNSIREIVSSSRSIEDISHVLVLEGSVRSKGSTLEEVAELYLLLRKNGILSGEISGLISLNRELHEQRLSLEATQYWMKLDQMLTDEGFSRPVRKSLINTSKTYGGINGMLKALFEINDLNIIKQQKMLLLTENIKLNKKNVDLESQINFYSKIIGNIAFFQLSDFDLVSLSMIPDVTEKLGGPNKVLEAISKYESIEEIDQELTTKKAGYEKISREIADKTGLTQVLTNKLNETTEAYARNKDLISFVDFFINPSGVRMSKYEVVLILSEILNICNKRIEESSAPFETPDPEWASICANLRSLATRLGHIKKHARSSNSDQN